MKNNNILYKLNTETDLIFDDYSSKNDSCEMVFSESKNISVYLPNTDKTELGHEEFNTFLVKEGEREIFENEKLELVINFLKGI